MIVFGHISLFRCLTCQGIAVLILGNWWTESSYFSFLYIATIPDINKFKRNKGWPKITWICPLKRKKTYL